MKATTSIRRFGIHILVACALLLGAACNRQPKITALQRKEAAHLSSEADFALNLREWARAEGLLAKAVKLCPDNGSYWTNLGVVRVRLGNKPGAREAYLAALKLVESDTEGEKKAADPWRKRIYLLALLGRVDEARKVLDQAARKFPANRNLRAFVEGKQLDMMLADPKFKQDAL